MPPNLTPPRPSRDKILGSALQSAWGPVAKNAPYVTGADATPAVAVDRLTFTYRAATTPAVRDLSFRIDRGEVFGFLGPSGAGKSTTQNVLIRLLTGYGGEVSVFGQDLTTWSADYYERVGVSFELPNHYLKLTGLENLAYFRALYSDETQAPEALLDLVGLQDDGKMLVSQYSKGMKTRLGVARALLNNPGLIFMDEPTAGLDPVSARRIKDLIRAQQRDGRTVFLTTHDMTVADELCDRVAFIVDGEIRLIESPRELKLAHGERTIQVEYGIDGRTELREFPLLGLGESAEFLELLRGGTIQTLHTKEATLEDVFIRVTGRELR